MDQLLYERSASASNVPWGHNPNSRPCRRRIGDCVPGSSPGIRGPAAGPLGTVSPSAAQWDGIWFVSPTLVPRPGYRPRMRSTAVSTRSSLARDSFPTRSVRVLRSNVTIWVAFATESLGSPEARAVRRTHPGASAQPRLLVSGTQTIVLRRLRLSASL